MKQTVHVTIQKPLYGTFVYVRDKYLKQAIREHTDITIHSGEYSCTVSPIRWIMDGKKLEKVFLIPDKPMVLYGNDILKYAEKRQESLAL